MKRQEADALFRGFLEGRVGRRDFIRRLLTTGASVTSVAALLEACSSNKDAPKPAAASSAPPTQASAAATQAASAPAPSTLSDLPEIEKELHIANWSDYIAENKGKKNVVEKK